EGYSADEEVRLLDAHIGSQLYWTGAQFSNPSGTALSADRSTVDGGLVCREGFKATGKVSLTDAHIGTQLNISGGQFSNPGGSALKLNRATVSGPLRMKSAVLEGVLDLTSAQTSSYHDDQGSWPQELLLDGFVYDAIEGASVKERLQWLRRNKSGYSPQIYDQLAAVYRAAGQDEDARRILIAKQRCRFAKRHLVWRVG